MYRLIYFFATMLEESRRTLDNENGQTLVEYGLLAVLIAVVVLLMLTGLGQEVNNLFSTVNSSLPNP
jgi:pilus assembly protein Flp/PilA